MTALDLNAIKARREAATEGPWRHMCLGSDGCIVLPTRGDLRRRSRRIAMFGWRDWQEDHRDAEFTAHAREDVDVLVDEVGRLRRELERVNRLNERERAARCAAEDRVHRAKTVRVWRNEDGKKFVFAKDLATALGITTRSRPEANDKDLAATSAVGGGEPQ